MLHCLMSDVCFLSWAEELSLSLSLSVAPSAEVFKLENSVVWGQELSLKTTHYPFIQRDKRTEEQHRL